MIRAVKVSLKAMTAAKCRRLEALRREVRGCTQRYVDSLWLQRGGLDAKTMRRVSGGSLSYRHRSNCLKVAIEQIVATKKSAKALGMRAGKPHVGSTIRLSSLVAQIERGHGSFDYVLKVSGLVKRQTIMIPFKGTARLNHWLGKPGAKLLQGCELGDNWASLWIEIPDEEPRKRGTKLAVDIGINKLLVDSKGTHYGTEIKAICQRVRRCKPGSKGKRRAMATRNCYIDRVVKELPWSRMAVIGVEDLNGLKTGKKKNRSKEFRKATAPWTYRHALTRIEQLAQENRVRLVKVDPRNTSRTCPQCGLVSAENRRGERFQCVSCNYTGDADYVGALNVLARTLGNSQESMVPASPCEERG